MKFSKWAVVCLCFLCSNAFAGYKWAKVADCFKPIELQVQKNIPEAEITDGCYYMLFDLQVNAITNQGYFHYAYKLTSENGVQNNSELIIEYNPAYQKLMLNSIRVYRNGKYIDYASKLKIKELQREEDLDYHIYDETTSVYIILEDIKIGDIIEYSYTREGSNPIFDNFFYRIYSYQMNYTLLNFNLRVIKPESLKLHIRKHKTDVEPVTKKTSLGEELIWQMSNIPGIQPEDLTPSWYDAYSYIEISSSDNWKDVREWGVKVFQSSDPLSGPLKNICREIKSKYSNDADRAIAALRFVQRNIRYLGIEIGVNSHKPSPPNKVFNQGFGDCKDKSLLLTKMLAEMGIKAYPAIVSTNFGRHINDYLPSPSLFNHTIVEVELNNNNYWFDPTLLNQGGDIDNYYISPYGYALILNGDSPKLDTMVVKAPSHIEIREYFDVKNLDGKAFLQVSTTYYGFDADDIRYSFAANSKRQIQDNYLEFYKNMFSKIDTIASISIKDDTIKNEVIVYERYEINDFWKSEDTIKKELIKADISAFNINSKISSYQNNQINRKSPLFLEYPLHFSHFISIKLPEEWNIKNSNEIIDNEFFTFSYKTSYQNQTIDLVYDYKTKKDFVQPEKSSAFIADIKKISNLMAYQISYDKSILSRQDSSSGLLISLFIGLTLILAFVCFFVYYKYIGKQEPGIVSYPDERIGGWVILPLIGLFISPFLVIFKTVKNKFFSDAMWQVITNSESAYYSLTLIFEIFVQGFYIVLPVFLLFMAFRYDKRFPRLMIYFYIFNLVVNVLDVSLVMFLPDGLAESGYKELFRSIVVAAVWIPFFSVSEKCKRIFIR